MVLLYVGASTYGRYYYGFDWTVLLLVVAGIFSLIASCMVKTTFRKYSKVRSYSGITAAQAAERLLRQNGIYDVTIEPISGELTDNYDPSSKVLHLSQSVYNNTSVAAIGVAAHECGHAMQHAKGYGPLVLRSAMVPTVNICSKLSWPVLVLGFAMGYNPILVNIGILLFSAAVLFSVVTLPVEFNASRRALKELKSNGLMDGKELGGARKVLTAAAMTYVAAAASMILQLLRLILLSGGRRRND